MKKDKEKGAGYGDIIGIIIVIFIVMAIIGFVMEGVEKGTKYMDVRSGKKGECAEEASYAKTDYAAKKTYKACMSN